MDVGDEGCRQKTSQEELLLREGSRSAACWGWSGVWQAVGLGGEGVQRWLWPWPQRWSSLETGGWRVGDTALRTSPLVIPRDLIIFYLNVEDDLGRWISPEFQKMSMVSSEEVWRRNVFLVRRKRI